MWTKYHIGVFLITFICFSFFHVTRKTFGSLKDLLAKEWSPVSCNKSWPCPNPNNTWNSHTAFHTYEGSQVFLGILDMLFSLSYGIGLFLSGIIGDRINMRWFMSGGMALSAVLLLIFGSVTEWYNIYNKPLYAALWFAQGLTQSVGWPVVVTVMGNWFQEYRGLVFGIWSSSASVGNVIGSLLTGAILEYGYEVAFFCSSCIFFFSSFIVFFGLVCSPTEVGIIVDTNATTDNERTEVSPTNNPEDETTALVVTAYHSKIPQESISFKNALFLPGVIPYALLFGCLKTINYAFFFWLPYYLVNTYGWSDKQSSQLSSWYDVGGIIGGIAFGLISDRMRVRSPVLLLMIFVMPFTIVIYSKSPNNVKINAALMSLVGVFVNGASNIVSSAVTTDVGKLKESENTRSLSTVTGIIDGVGTLGVALGQVVISVIMHNHGWTWVFNFLTIISGAAFLCIFPIFIRDMNWGRRCCLKRTGTDSEREPLLS